MTIAYVDFAPEHLQGVVDLCRAEHWPTYPDNPGRALSALTAPGATTVVAVEEDQVVGFAAFISDGLIQAYLVQLVVAAQSRRQGVGAQLLHEGFTRAGGIRLDVLADPEATGFYEHLPHRRLPGYRIYPAPH